MKHKRVADSDAINPSISQLDIENQTRLGKELNSWSNNTIPIDTEKGYIDQMETVTPTKRSGWWRYAGIIFALAAACSFTISTLTSKILSQKNYNAINIALWKNLGMLLFLPLVLYIRYGKKQRIFDIIWTERGKFFILLMLRGTIGFFGLTLFMLSLKHLNMADASVIILSTPIVVTFFARVCLGESCGIIPVVNTFISLSGVIILMRPPLLTGEEDFDTNILIGASYAFGTMVCLSTTFIIMRSLRNVHFSIVIMFHGYVSSIESLILAFCLGVLELPRTSEDYVIVAGNALFTLIGQSLMTLALKYEEAGPIALVRTSDIVLVFTAQLVFLGVYPDYISILGAGIIMFGIVVTTCRKWLSTLPEKHPNRMKYGFLLK